VRVLGFLLKYFSCLYHLVLGIFLTGLALIFLITKADNIKLGMLPWKGESLKLWLLGLGALGVFSALMALLGRIRILLVLVSLLVLILVVRGYFAGPYTFSGAAEAKAAAWLCVGALLAFFGSLMQYSGSRRY
jgi:hypothetical protein